MEVGQTGTHLEQVRVKGSLHPERNPLQKSLQKRTKMTLPNSSGVPGPCSSLIPSTCACLHICKAHSGRAEQRLELWLLTQCKRQELDPVWSSVPSLTSSAFGQLVAPLWALISHPHKGDNHTNFSWFVLRLKDRKQTSRQALTGSISYSRGKTGSLTMWESHSQETETYREKGARVAWGECFVTQTAVHEVTWGAFKVSMSRTRPWPRPGHVLGQLHHTLLGGASEISSIFFFYLK